jgi:hypothetical protein
VHYFLFHHRFGFGMNLQSCSNTYLYAHTCKVLELSSADTSLLVKDNVWSRSLQLVTSHLSFLFLFIHSAFKL